MKLIRKNHENILCAFDASENELAELRRIRARGDVFCRVPSLIETSGYFVCHFVSITDNVVTVNLREIFERDGDKSPIVGGYGLLPIGAKTKLITSETEHLDLLKNRMYIPFFVLGEQ